MAEKKQAKIDVTDGAAIPSEKDRGLLSRGGCPSSAP
jgi:hypothetical protein